MHGEFKRETFMLISLFLAKFLGLYMLIVSAIWLLRKRQLQDAIEQIFSSRALIAIMGFLSLFIGLAIVISHPIWEMNWRSLITIIGYLEIVRGILRLGFPSFVSDVGSKVLRDGYWFVLPIVALLGVYLTFHGFFGGQYGF
jgi:hypothetical protein